MHTFVSESIRIGIRQFHAHASITYVFSNVVLFLQGKKQGDGQLEFLPPFYPCPYGSINCRTKNYQLKSR